MRTCLAITVWNRATLLSRSLARIAELTVPDRILVVDDGSTDLCRDVCVSFDGRLPIERIYNHRPHLASCCQPRNVALKAAEDFDLFMTSEPEMYWVTDVYAQMLELIEKQGDDPIKQQLVSAGTVLHEQPPGCTCPCGQCAGSPVEDGRVHVTVNWSATWVALYKRDWLMRVGGWDEGFEVWGWDDVDLNTRLRVSGVGQLVDKDIVVRHQYHEPVRVDQSANERRFLSKGVTINEDTSAPDLVANDVNDPTWGRPV